MTDPKLIFIPSDIEQSVLEIQPAEYGELSHGTPTFDFMRKGINCSTIEHVWVRWLGRNAHLFIDEEGLLDKPPRKPNHRASALRFNYIINRHGGPGFNRVLSDLIAYDDLEKVPPVPLQLMFSQQVLIVGHAYLWTGEME